MATQKISGKMYEYKTENRSPRALAARNRKANQVRKRSKHADMGIYAKPKSSATRARKA